MAADDWNLFGTSPRGVLVTVKKDGRPQLSNVGYTFDSDTHLVLISVTDDRAKTRNLRRDPRASFYVTTPDLSAYAVGEGSVEFGEVAKEPFDAATDELVAHYQLLRGEHDDWEEFRAAMVSEQRVLLRLHLTRAYGWSPA